MAQSFGQVSPMGISLPSGSPCLGQPAFILRRATFAPAERRGEKHASAPRMAAQNHHGLNAISGEGIIIIHRHSRWL
jgi:hypothetical protein